MAVPKRKTSKSRRNKRRSHHRISSVNIIEDKKSGEFRLSHHVDLKTGVYNGKQIIIKKAVGVNENKTSLIKKSNLEIKNLFSKVGIFLIS